MTLPRGGRLVGVPPLPLERIQHYGSETSFRYRSSLIHADNDIEAIQSWLNEYVDTPNTWRSYRKEAERLLNWAILCRGKTLAALDRDDFREYTQFLKNPGSQWCAPVRPRHDEGWRPFVGALSERSIFYALSVLQSMLTWLVYANYLRANPLTLMKQKYRSKEVNPHHKQTACERFLDREMWEQVCCSIAALPESTDREIRMKIRYQTLFAFLYLTGLRISEVAAAKFHFFHQRNQKWWYQVTGKGSKTAHIPITDELMGYIGLYREHLGMSLYPSHHDEGFVIRSLSGKKGISANMIHRLVKSLFQRAADDMDDERRASYLRQASAHWLRHTFGTHATEDGIDIRHLKRVLRHSRMETTEIYMHEKDEILHDQVSKHRLGYVLI